MWFYYNMINEYHKQLTFTFINNPIDWFHNKYIDNKINTNYIQKLDKLYKYLSLPKIISIFYTSSLYKQSLSNTTFDDIIKHSSLIRQKEIEHYKIKTLYIKLMGTSYDINKIYDNTFKHNLHNFIVTQNITLLLPINSTLLSNIISIPSKIIINSTILKQLFDTPHLNKSTLPNNYYHQIIQNLFIKIFPRTIYSINKNNQLIIFNFYNFNILHTSNIPCDKPISRACILDNHNILIESNNYLYQYNILHNC